MKYQKNSFKKTVVVGTILVSSAFVFQVSAQTWANPACAPTGCNAPTPINVSGTAQTKAGNFILGGRMEVKNTAPQLWLNENDQTSAALGLWRFLGWEGNLHLYRNLSAAKDFATQSRVISILGANNNIGLGIEPTTKLDVNGQIKIRGGVPGLNKILASDAEGLASWKTKEELGIVGGGTDTSKWTSSGLNIFNKNTGNVGIGMNNPTSLLTVQGNSTKLSEVKIIGTNDTTNNSIGLNVDSARNAHVILDRGNTGQTSYVRHATGGTTDWYAGINARQNSDYQISNTFNGEVGQLTIKKSNGNVGIGKNNPVTKLDVLGSGYFSSALGVAGKAIVGGAEIKNTAPELWLNESDETSAGLGLWRLQGWNGNFHLYRNTSANKDFSTQSRALSILGANNYVGIGIAPTAKLDVDGQVKIRGGAPGLNKILASDADGLSTWKTPTEIGIDGSNWTLTDNNLTNKNSGNVGIGSTNPQYRLDVGTGASTGGLRIKTGSNSDGITGNIYFTNTTSEEIHSRITGARSGGTNGKLIFSTRQAGTLLPVMTLNESGNVGIGTNNPTSALSIERASTGASINVKSSSFNSGITLDKGGARRSSFIAHSSLGSIDWYAGVNGGIDGDNSYKVSTDFSSDPLDSQLTLSKSGTLDISGVLRMRGGSPGLNKILASDSSGYSSWKTPTEIGISGSNWILAGNDVYRYSGNVGLGTNFPTAKLDIAAGQIRIRQGATTAQAPAANKILSAVDATGSATWKTAAELGISSNWTLTDNNLTNNNTTGNVGVGKSPSYKLDIKGDLRITDNDNDDRYLKISSETLFGQIQTYNSKPLYINPLGNNVVLNRNGGKVGIGKVPLYELDVNGKGNFSGDLVTDDNLLVVGNSQMVGSVSVSGATSLIGATSLYGPLTIHSGTPRAGKVLTSDATGIATWQSSASGITTIVQAFTAPEFNLNPFDPDFNIQLFRVVTGTVSCPVGKVAVSGGAEVVINQFGARTIGLAGVALGQQSDGGQGGIAVGLTNMKSPVSKPGTGADNTLNSVDGKRSWFCSTGGEVAGNVTLKCYARCL